MIPILQRHDHCKAPIGMVQFKDGLITFRFDKPVTREEMFAIFGDAGIQVLKHDGVRIYEGVIHTWSLNGSEVTP